MEKGNKLMHYGNIKFNDIANGEGVRTSLFVSGCTHHCKECFNPETWDFNYGKEFTQEVEDKIAEKILLGELEKTGTIIIDCEDGKLDFENEK